MRSLGRLWAHAGQSRRSCTRCLSTTGALLSAGKLAVAQSPEKFTWACSRGLDRTIIRYTQLFYKGTKDPIWMLLKRLKYPGNKVALTEALNKHGLSFDDYKKWQRVVLSPNIEDSLTVLQEMGFWCSNTDIVEDLRSDQSIPYDHLPPWLVIHIISHKIRTRNQAQGLLLDFVFSQLPHFPSNLQPALLIITTLSLSRFSLLSPMRRIVNAFLVLPLPKQSVYFNLLLRALSTFPSSEETAKIAVTVLEAMESRQVKLQSQTYTLLLSDRFVTVELTKKLWDRMAHEHFVPQRKHLEGFLRVFAKEGSIHDWKQYKAAIREQLPKKLKGSISDLSNQEADMGSHSPDILHTMYLNAFRNNRLSAFQYLDRLLNFERQRLAAPSQSVPSTRHSSYIWDHSRRRFVRSLYPRNHIPHKDTFANIYDWTTLLAIAARDKKKTTGEMLLRLFDRGSTNASFRPTVATYTVVIRGLRMRKMHAEAERLWHRLASSGLVLDRKALTIGLQVLTRAGKPHEAFALLEHLAARSNPRLGIPRVTYEIQGQTPIVMNTIAFNEFLIALARIRRTDVVFRLWDHMETLYGIRPDAKTLNCLLMSTRVATKTDDSLSGAMAQLSSIFKKESPKPSEREEVVASIIDILGDPEHGLKAYKSGIWNGGPAWRNAREIFRQVIFGNWSGLRDIRAPVTAVRSSVNDTSFRPMLGLARDLAKPYNNEAFLPRLMVSLDQGYDGLYPEIVPTDHTFYRYVELLGTHSYAAEIPLALAWMRALGIMPSKDTLALSLVFWGEVSLQAPLIERWSGGWEKSEYVKLILWMRDWVGHSNMPKDDDIGTWLRRVALMRGSENVSAGYVGRY